MAKHYKYVNGKRLVVVNNYDLGSDVIPEEVNLIPDITQADEGKVLTVNSSGTGVEWATPSGITPVTAEWNVDYQNNEAMPAIIGSELAKITSNGLYMLTIPELALDRGWRISSAFESAYLHGVYLLMVSDISTGFANMYCVVPDANTNTSVILPALWTFQGSVALVGFDLRIEIEPDLA